jgi:hypothetical protein
MSLAGAGSGRGGHKCMWRRGEGSCLLLPGNCVFGESLPGLSWNREAASCQTPSLGDIPFCIKETEVWGGCDMPMAPL